MVDHDQIVCCMCGDVGFPHKLFRCNLCHHRFQHSYCSKLYGELAEIEVCDWCQSEGKKTRQFVGSSNNVNSKGSSSGGGSVNGDQESTGKRKSPMPSPRHTTRRYKLLKDVMC